MSPEEDLLPEVEVGGQEEQMEQMGVVEEEVLKVSTLEEAAGALVVRALKVR